MSAKASKDIDVLVYEVGPRDGLQATTLIMPTHAKVAWTAVMKDSELRKIQVGSFVPPKLLAQMADSAEVTVAATAIGGFTVSALVPNLKGAENALAAGADELNFVMPASEAHNLKNVRKTQKESILEFQKIVELRNSTDRYQDVTISGGLMHRVPQATLSRKTLFSCWSRWGSHESRARWASCRT